MVQLNGRSLVLFVVLFTSFIAVTYGFGIYLFPAIAPAMIADIGFTYAEMGVTTGLAQAGFMIVALISGFLTTWIGAFNLIRLSMFLCALSLGGILVADDFVSISFFLIVLGGAAASVWVPMVEVSQRCIHSGHRGKALGLMSSGTSYGVFANGIFISLMLDSLGWRSLWAAAFFVVVVLGLYSWFVFRRIENSIGRDIRETASSDIQTGVLQKLRSVPLGLTVLILAMMFLNGVSCLPFQTYLSSFLVDERNLSLEEAAAAWRVIGMVGMVGGFIMGAVADRISVKWALIITYIFLASSAALLLFADIDLSGLYVLAALFGMSFYAIFGLVPAYISHVYRTGTASLVFSFGNVALGLGGVAGNSIGGWLKEASGTFEWIYIVILCAALGSVLVSLMMRNERSAEPQTVQA